MKQCYTLFKRVNSFPQASLGDLAITILLNKANIPGTDQLITHIINKSHMGKLYRLHERQQISETNCSFTTIRIDSENKRSKINGIMKGNLKTRKPMSHTCNDIYISVASLQSACTLALFY